MRRGRAGPGSCGTRGGSRGLLECDRRQARRRRLALGLLGSGGALLLAVMLVRMLGPWPGGAASCAVVVLTVALADRWMRRPGGVPVLVYHSVSDDSGWLPWAFETSVSSATFERHLRIIRRCGCVVLRTHELARRRRAGQPVPRNALVLHLDDGYLDNWVAALPLLRAAGIPATLFVSLDFIEPGDDLRPTLDDVASGRCSAAALRWHGHANWAELRAMQASGLIEIEPHGTDHGRVETGPKVVDEVRPDTWRRLAWVQWRAMPGDKSGWYRHEHPPAVPYGTPVRESEAALAARAWSPAGLEADEAYEARVRGVLRQSRDELERALGIRARVFCWPQNRASPRAREIAGQEGYLATTGGRGENRAHEDPAILSRTHVGDRALGWRWLAAEGLAVRAIIRAGQGNGWWELVLLAMGLSRRLAIKVYWQRRRSRSRLAQRRRFPGRQRIGRELG